jgi:hypothetical protein
MKNHRRDSVLCAILLFGSLLCPLMAVAAGIGPVEGGALPGPLPLFPADNWWNLDISSAPVDPNSPGFINFINNGGTRHLHPDFGGEVSPGSTQIYGMPYAVVDGTQPRLTVDFMLYGDESDGVGVPFYPIPAEAITQPHWIEGGDPGNVDRRGSEDRHLLIVDRDQKYLYELYNVYYNASTGRWEAGSGAFWDMNTNDRRPEGWTSADAAGLAILPGLVRYDEVYDPSVTEIQHAFRATVRTTNSYVYPASHSAGSTAGALPMGARLRLKASKDISGFPPEMQKVFRAMKKYGLIVADNGSDMYITGTFDTRWNNDVLNPAFYGLTASDFEVVQLGWNPISTSVSLSRVTVSPSSVVGGQSSTGTVTLSGGAPSGGAVVALESSDASVAIVPASVTIDAGLTSASFSISTSSVAASTLVVVSAAYDGVGKSATLTVAPAPPPTLSSLALNPTTVRSGTSAIGTVTLSGPAPSGGVIVNLKTSRPAVAAVPPTITVPAGQSSAAFTISTVKASRNWSVVIYATYKGTTRKATLKVLQ